MTSNGILELASGGNNDRGHLKLHADHGTSPRTSIIEFQNEGTTGSFLFTDASQNLKFHTSDPGEDDSVGNIVLLESSDISTGHITASGDISASGTLY